MQSSGIKSSSGPSCGILSKASPRRGRCFHRRVSRTTRAGCSQSNSTANVAGCTRIVRSGTIASPECAGKPRKSTSRVWSSSYTGSPCVWAGPRFFAEPAGPKMTAGSPNDLTNRKQKETSGSAFGRHLHFLLDNVQEQRLQREFLPLARQHDGSVFHCEPC